LRAAGAAPEDAFPGMSAPEVSLLRSPIGPPQLTNPRMPRRAIESEPLPEIETDPAIEAFVLAKDAFRRRTTVTPERIAAFLDAHLAPGRRLRGSDITIADVDAFVVFQRLREIDVLFDGSLRARYRLAPGEGRLSNGWIDCPDFSIERVAEAKSRRPAVQTR
ncbi:MAG: Wadjet anti-phage system protein JetA family protein, partial [Methylorubrum rhodinum]|uniref:Wadjet anti-phage system protein JetA family protein n=1 Tax=Methylorubrum rhodinum TaxID=29428 RepID=UPI003BAF1A6F